MGTNTIPNDTVAEESLIGAMLLSAEAALIGLENIRAEDFYLPYHQRVFTAINSLVENGIPVDSMVVASEMRDSENVSKLISMQFNCPNPANAFVYAQIVMKHSVSRRMLSKLSTSQSEVSQGNDPYEVANDVEKFITGLATMNSNEPQSLTISQLAEKLEEIAPVVIPGMLHKDYRTIVVAGEGAGKSLLLRTIAMTASQGFHPFSHQRIEPIRALIVDLENPAQAILQTAGPLKRNLQMRNPEGYDEERLRIWRKPGGMEIRRMSDRAELQREIAFHRPDLVCIGPIYKMTHRGANESYEDAADEAMAVLDDLRTKYGFALVMEHHAAKGKAGEKRDLSPMGSQRWMAWPEIGISLYPDGEDPTVMHVKRFRGDRLTGVNWPDKIVRDSVWLVDGVWNGPTGL
jgi:replicative DNA helicase